MDERTRRRVMRGEVVVESRPEPGYSNPRLVVHAVVDAPPDRVWALIDDSSRYTGYMPRVKQSRELSRTPSDDGDVVETQMTIDMPFPLKDLTAVTRAKHVVVDGELYSRRWDLVRGDYQRNTGSWTFVPVPDDPSRTLVRYEIHVVTHSKLPKKVVGLAQERAIPKLIQALRDNAR